MISKTVARAKMLPSVTITGGTMRKKSSNYVSVTPFRERFEKLEKRDGLTLSDVAARLEWFESRNDGLRPDATRVARLLGLQKNGANRPPTKNIAYNNAAKLCRALDLYPIDVGI